MLTRLIILGLLAAAAIYGWNVWRGPKLLRVPLVWSSMSRRHTDLAEALRLRKAIGLLLIQAKDARAERILKEVDLVIRSLVQLAKVRDSRGVSSDGDTTSAAALEELEALYSQLTVESNEQTQDRLDTIRERLAERTVELKASVDVRKEINDS